MGNQASLAAEIASPLRNAGVGPLSDTAYDEDDGTKQLVITTTRVHLTSLLHAPYSYKTKALQMRLH